MSECTCFELPPEMWTTHYGAVEPGSTHEPNPDCPEHFRKPPYRLTDGTWSDGVDRTRRLSSSEFGEENPQRLGIFRPSFIDEEWIARGDVWVIVRVLKSVEWFATHAEAIAYANKLARMARTNQGENND